MYRTRINISKSVIEQAFNEGWHDTLYYYILLRSKYKKPIFYNYSFRKVAKDINCAPSVAAKHIKILLEKNLAYIDYGHLCFRSQTNVLKKFKHKIVMNLPVHIQKRRMIDELRGVLIVRVLDNQIESAFKKSAIVNKCKIANAKVSKKEYKFLEKNGGSAKIEKTRNKRMTLSNRAIGKLFKRSQSTGKLYQKRLNQMGILKSRQKIDILSEVCNSDMLRNAPNGCFRTINNQLARQRSNTIWSPYMKSYDNMLKKHPIVLLYNKKNTSNNIIDNNNDLKNTSTTNIPAQSCG
jgi:hypothetical protein